MPKPGPTDTVPALLTPGEHVMNLEAVALLGADNLVKANKAGLKMRNKTQGYANGGTVNQPLATTGILNPAVKPIQFNANNTVKEFLGDSGVQSSIGAAVKPISTGALQNTSEIGANLQTDSSQVFAPKQDGALKLSGYSQGTLDTKGIFACHQDQRAKSKMVVNSKPSQIGNISFLENTDLQGFEEGGEVKKPVYDEAGIPGLGIGASKKEPVLDKPVIANESKAGFVGIPDVRGAISNAVEATKNAFSSAPELPKAVIPSSSSSSKPITSPAPITNIPTEQMLPGANNYVGLGDKGYITSANQAGIGRVNALVARGGINNPEREARAARDAAAVAAQTAKYGDGKDHPTIQQPVQQVQIPQGTDYSEEIANTLDELSRSTPTMGGFDALLANKKNMQNANARLGILRGLQQSKMQQAVDNAKLQTEQNQFLQNMGLKNKELDIGQKNAEATAAAVAAEKGYQHGRDTKADEFKNRELSSAEKKVTIKMVEEPDPSDPTGLKTRVVAKRFLGTGEEVNPEADKQLRLERKGKMDALLAGSKLSPQQKKTAVAKFNEVHKDSPYTEDNQE
jgi:hypothetical protein